MAQLNNELHRSETMKKLALALSATYMLCAQTHAGFADSMRDLRGALSQITDTTKEITGVSKEFGSFKGTANTNNSNYKAGQSVYPKINNLALYQTANKSSSVLTKLSKSTDLVFSGNASNNGFIEVSTEHGNGWVEAHLVQ
jgi:hypothetical protein